MPCPKPGRGRAAGFADYVTKPIDVGRLLRVVDQLAGRGRLRGPGLVNLSSRACGGGGGLC